MPPALKISSHKLHPRTIPSPPTVSAPSNVVSAPFNYAESSRHLRFAIALLVVELLVKARKSRQHILPRCKLHPCPTPSSTTVSAPSNIVSAPSDHAESSPDLRFAIALPVVELLAKSAKIPPAKSRPTNFTPAQHHHHLLSAALPMLFLHLSDTLNPAVTSVLP
jgi:hypothetical protein